MSKYSAIDEKFLITKLRKGDEDAFDYIFYAYYKGLVLCAKEFTEDMDTAEEIVQGVFVKFWAEREKIQINSSIKAYLVKSVQNKCLDFLKHRKITKKYSEKVQKEISDDENNSEELILTYELKEKIENSIKVLPDNCREIFRKSRYEGKKYREIAEELGLSVKTVEAQIGKALKKLRDELKDFLPVLLISFMLIGL